MNKFLLISLLLLPFEYDDPGGLPEPPPKKISHQDEPRYRIKTKYFNKIVKDWKIYPDSKIKPKGY